MHYEELSYDTIDGKRLIEFRSTQIKSNRTRIAANETSECDLPFGFLLFIVLVLVVIVALPLCRFASSGLVELDASVGDFRVGVRRTLAGPFRDSWLAVVVIDRVRQAFLGRRHRCSPRRR